MSNTVAVIVSGIMFGLSIFCSVMLYISFLFYFEGLFFLIVAIYLTFYSASLLNAFNIYLDDSK